MSEISSRFLQSSFTVTDSAAIMGGYYNRVPVVTHFSFRTHKSRILPGLLNESGDLTQVKTYPNGNFDVLIAAKNFNGQKTIWLKTMTLVVSCSETRRWSQRATRI